MDLMESISDIVCAVNLQYLSEIFKKVGAFVIAIDAGNKAKFSSKFFGRETAGCVFNRRNRRFGLGKYELRSSSDAQDMETHDNIVSTIANFSLQIVAGISKVCAEQNNQNSSANQLPPARLVDLCSVH